VDFQQTRDSGWNRPFFTYTLLVVCTIVLFVSYALNGWKVEPLSVNPMIGPSAETLIRMGAKQTSLIVNRGEWYRLFSPMVLHAGLIHYFLNMMALLFIGKAVEQCHGFTAAAIIFIIPAVGGTIMSAIFLPEYISVGASGGIFGLIGACIADICINWSLLFSKHVNSNDEGTRFRHMKVRFRRAFIFLLCNVLTIILVLGSAMALI
jgi:membrane associated rhomboid family serine protease